MLLPVQIQLAYFIATIAAGCLVGAMIDLYRVIMAGGYHNKLLLGLSDLLFWIFCAMAVFVFFLETNHANFRYYTLLGMLFGVFLYFKLASKQFIIAMRAFIQALVRMTRVLYLGISFPIKCLVYLLKLFRLKAKVLMKNKG